MNIGAFCRVNYTIVIYVVETVLHIGFVEFKNFAILVQLTVIFSTIDELNKIGSCCTNAIECRI